uniref:Uncharacterized protein n=1 Tax=Arundo donax TaxID=35708 RepID=A0A0A9ETU8_ARUDO
MPGKIHEAVQNTNMFMIVT